MDYPQHPPGFDFTGSMRFYHHQQQPESVQHHPPQESSPPQQFSQEKYDLFRGSFEAAANLQPASSESGIHQQSSFYTQTPPWKDYAEEGALGHAHAIPHPHSYKQFAPQV